jgi:hypothetical protein
LPAVRTAPLWCRVTRRPACSSGRYATETTRSRCRRAGRSLVPRRTTWPRGSPLARPGRVSPPGRLLGRRIGRSSPCGPLCRLPTRPAGPRNRSTGSLPSVIGPTGYTRSHRPTAGP